MDLIRAEIEINIFVGKSIIIVLRRLEHYPVYNQMSSQASRMQMEPWPRAQFSTFPAEAGLSLGQLYLEVACFLRFKPS